MLQVQAFQNISEAVFILFNTLDDKQQQILIDQLAEKYSKDNVANNLVTYKEELLKAKEAVDNGEILYSFTSDEFAKINDQLIEGKQIDFNQIRKVKKDGQGNFIPA